MADDIKIDIEVDSHEVVRAEKHFKSLNRQYAVLDKAAKSGRISSQQHTKAVFNLNTQLNGLEKSMKRGGDALRQYNTRLNMAKNRTNRFGMVSQQVGYQVGDFFVQVQSGTSALVAFGQQGTQLAGLLPGVAGAIIGIGLAIGTMVLRTRQQMNESETGLKAYSEAMKSLKEETKELIAENKRLAGGFVTVEQMFIEARKNALREEIKLLQANIKLREDINNNAISTGWWARLKESVSSIDFKKIFKGYKELQEQMDRPLEVLAMEKSILEKEKQLGGIEKEEAKAALLEEVNRELRRNELLKKVETLRNQTRFKIVSDINEKIKKAEEENDKESIKRIISTLNKEAQEYKKRIKFVRPYFDVISGQESVNKQPKQEDYISPFDAIMAQEFVDQERLKQSRIKFAKDMEILAKQLAFKGGMEQMAKYLLPQEEFRRFKVLDDKSLQRQKMLKLELKYGEDSKELFDAKTQAQKEQLILSLKEQNINTTLRGLLGQQFVEERKIEWAIRQQVDALEEVERAEEDLADKRKQFADQIGGYLESGFMSMIDGTKSVAEAFRSMAADILKHLYKVLVVQTAIRNIGGAIGGTFGAALSTYGLNANGNAFNNGKIIPYANGGVVNYPTMFPMSGGKTGLMGEAGPEAILPLKRGPNGKLGVESSGGSVVVNQTINVSTGVAQTVRNEIKTLMPQIAEGAKSAVLDAKRRGGSFGSAFA
jgi:lambda family phage tail tape measure protein